MERDRSFVIFIIVTLIILSIVGFYYIYRISDLLISIRIPLEDPYVRWDMDSILEDKLLDSGGSYTAILFNVEVVEGHSGKAVYFNGKDSHIETPVNFQGWKAVTISFWIKPENKEENKLSVILDNGHTATKDFTIQSADYSEEKWVWHCNGIDIFLDIPLGGWTHVVVSADTVNRSIQAFVNGIKIGVRQTVPFEFGPTPFVIGKLSNAEDRYFKGTIDELEIWNKTIGSD